MQLPSVVAVAFSAVALLAGGALSQSCGSFWLEKISHRGVAPFAGTSGYKVFRNVKDYGAKGDGITDDTAAINLAISDANRCGPGCTGSTTTPALIYFPQGTYLVTAPIIDYYYTQLMGNPKSGCRPVLKAAPTFSARWLLDGNPYGANGLAWGATNVFWRQVSNFVIDLTSVPASTLIAGIHWPTSQSTSLHNIEFKMSRATTGNQHQGLFVEEGSAGYVGDLVFDGGAQAMAIGNQQFTMRSITIRNAQTAIQQIWSWGWTYKDITIENCGVGWDLSATNPNTGTLDVGSVTILDSKIVNTPVGIRYGNVNSTTPANANTIVLENIALDRVPVAIQGPAAKTILAGTPTRNKITGWARGSSYNQNGVRTVLQGTITPNPRTAPLSYNGRYVTKSKPQYVDTTVGTFLSARAAGALGNSVADDTSALNALFERAARTNKIVFLDAGIYRVTNTLYIPPGSRIFGEALPIILSSGSKFNDMKNPRPVVQVGKPGETGRIEWSNTIVSTRGAQAGAILIEYNLKTATPSSGAPNPSGMWDVHTRIGGFAGSNQQLADCPKTPNVVAKPSNIPAKCIAAFMSMHIRPTAAGLYMENCWIWVADHDVEIGAHNEQITIYAGRGLLVEGTRGPIWLSASSVEHHQRYQYQFINVRNVYGGQLQTETAYYQPNPDATLPFPARTKYFDPTFGKGGFGWGLRVVDSSSTYLYGVGLYSFFNNNNVTCSQIGSGKRCQGNIFSAVRSKGLRVYGLNTVGTQNMVMVNGKSYAPYTANPAGFVASVAQFWWS